MKDEENMVWSASKVLIVVAVVAVVAPLAVTVVKFHIALILLLVDDVLLAFSSPLSSHCWSIQLMTCWWPRLDAFSLQFRLLQGQGGS